MKKQMDLRCFTFGNVASHIGGKMNWRVGLGQALAAIAALVLLIELSEFLILGYVWVDMINAKITTPFENAVIFGTTMAMILVTALAYIATLFSIWLKRIWPTLRIFISIQVFTVLIQVIFLLIGSISFQGDWLVDFFDEKKSTFIVGIIAALLLIFVGLVIRPWHVLPVAKPIHRT